jgi:chromosome segregation ATPase|tara:strand:- start:6668 stop:7210 length:543 start_codon:yes stop_codon:yes gene_type:complete
MSLLELLHNEKVVRFLEEINTNIKDIIEPSEKDNAIFMKIILIIETLLKKSKHPNSHIGEYFERFYDNQTNIDDINEEIKQNDVKVSELSYDMDMRNVEIEKLEWTLNELKGKMDFDKGEIASIKGKLEGMNWEPVRLQDWIEESSHPIDKNNIEGIIFDKLKEELIDKNKLNYNYGREE